MLNHLKKSTGEFFYAGNYVMLDHGMGLISSYSHLSSINVKEGENIKKGMPLIAVAPNFVAGIVDNEPLKLPIGVLTADTI